MGDNVLEIKLDTIMYHTIHVERYVNNNYTKDNE